MITFGPCFHLQLECINTEGSCKWLPCCATVASELNPSHKLSDPSLGQWHRSNPELCSRKFSGELSNPEKLPRIMLHIFGQCFIYSVVVWWLVSKVALNPAPSCSLKRGARNASASSAPLLCRGERQSEGLSLKLALDFIRSTWRSGPALRASSLRQSPLHLSAKWPKSEMFSSKALYFSESLGSLANSMRSSTSLCPCVISSKFGWWAGILLTVLDC